MPAACFSQKEIKFSLTRGAAAPPDWSFQGVGAGRFGCKETCRWHVLAQKKSRRSHLNPWNRNPPPAPSFPHFFGKKWGARRVGGAGGASDKNPAKPPSKKRRAPLGNPGRVSGQHAVPLIRLAFSHPPSPPQGGRLWAGGHRPPLRALKALPRQIAADYGRIISAPTVVVARAGVVARHGAVDTRDGVAA